MIGGSLTLLLAIATITKAEYTWTGTDWKWQNPPVKDSSPPRDLDQEEGSGDTSDTSFGVGSNTRYDEDDDSYDDYDDDNIYPYGNGQSGKTAKNVPANTFDDEDMGAEGSGYDEEEEEEEGSGSHDSVHRPGRIDVVTNPPWNSNMDTRITDDLKPKFGAEDPIIVDSVNNDPDVFFPGKEDLGKEVDVTTTTTTWKHVEPKTTESPSVHKEGPTQHRSPSFFAQPGILAAVIGGAVVGLLCAILLVMFIVYRMRKKDEGSYALDEPKRAHNANSYSKPPSREFYA